MTVVVKNVGAVQPTAQGQINTANADIAMGNQGTVNVVVGSQTWTFGPNETRTFADDGIGIAVAAADARLRVIDSRDALRTLRS